MPVFVPVAMFVVVEPSGFEPLTYRLQGHPVHHYLQNHVWDALFASLALRNLNFEH
jgi:hypothetical protein